MFNINYCQSDNALAEKFFTVLVSLNLLLKTGDFGKTSLFIQKKITEHYLATHSFHENQVTYKKFEMQK